MLENSLKGSTHVALTGDVNLSSTTPTDIGLSLYLLANTTYYINILICAESDGDGFQYSLQRSAALAGEWLSSIEPRAATGFEFTTATSYTNTAAAEAVRISGILRTGAAGKIYLELRKNTNVAGPTVITSASHIVATLL